MRGGVYNHSSKITIGTNRNGSAALPIKLTAYPNEIPVLDFSGQAEQAGNDGLRIDASYWHIPGYICGMLVAMDSGYTVVTILLKGVWLTAII
jgi:pectate disaccharide-lyase